ncbi:extradiol ring-cleavage dioxygenase [Pseudonocardia acidicola]|uniref:Extradiol ring-cleavage dioxygenase n=1 Tax=Pseudonocardia acidicola TaxID=2724939 RepID=A0ABX1S8X1_9PSEU|nr:extradiol ring-cleavage dioxygenase [Pseudonocardia acidicola]NMH97349.1 extradiol ring-cleavage dioxygenase [Pseudonocardia acidicola]
MGTIVAGLASSHAFAFMEPEHWDEFRERNRQMLFQRSGILPPVQDGVHHESLAENRERFSMIRGGLDQLRAVLTLRQPDAMVVIGDDQDENFTAANVPQLAVHVGSAFQLGSPLVGSRATYRVHRELAMSLLEQGVDEGFDIASVGSFPGGELRSHAHAQVLAHVAPEADIPVVLVFINAIHHPAITPRRCAEFGQLLARVVRRRPEGERVAVYASGGWSHFTAGYPWAAYQGPHTHGAIDSAFDREVLHLLETGEGRKLAELTAADLLEHGEIELRAWIALVGALDSRPADFIVYEPFYRALMGMAVAAWTPRMGN